MSELDLATKLNIVTDYYGTGTIWDRMSINGLSADQINAMYNSLPASSFTVDRTPSGLNLGRNYSNPFELPVTPGTDFDSNIPGGSYGGGNTFTGNIPANLQVDPNTGLPVRQSAGPTTSGGSVLPAVADRISLAVAGVNIGARLGLAIDNALYNLNPAWWDEHLPAINPQTWNTLVGQNPVGDFFLRTLFGITGDNMTGYISDDMIAYYYQMLRDAGAFGTGGKSITVNNPTVGNRTMIHVPQYTSPGFISRVTTGGESSPVPHGAIVTSGTVDFSWCCKQNNSNDMKWWFFSKTPFTLSSTLNSNITTPSIITSTLTHYYEDKPIYYTSQTTYNSNFNPHPITVISPYIEYKLSQLIEGGNGTEEVVGQILLYQSTIEDFSPVSGISQLPDSTQYPPTNITGNTPQQVKQQLQQEYPDLFTDAITERTLQDDGSIKETTYVPIPWVTDGLNPEQPVTGDGRTQSDTNVDQTTSQEILPTTPPDEPTQPPATGEGETPIPAVPTGSASSLWAVYNPSQGQLNSFGAWLWSSDFVEQLKKLFADPMQAIIGVHKVFATPSTSGSQTIKCGYLDSGVSAAVVTNQYTTVDCGSASLREYFGNVFDYDPFTKVSIFLPFIGIVPLNTADVMRSTVSVKYKVDVITGACLAEVSVSRDGVGGILYTYGGSAIVTYPVSSGSYIGAVQAALSTAIGIGSAIATGGASLGASAGMVLGGLSHAKTQVQHSGQFSGCSGAMGGKKPYLIISRPQTRTPQRIAEYEGIPTNSIHQLINCNGFTKVKEVHIMSKTAYDNEIQEIESLLKTGVIF